MSVLERLEKLKNLRLGLQYRKTIGYVNLNLI